MREDARSCPLSEADMSARVLHCLHRIGCRTLGDVVRHTEAELLAVKNFGKISLAEVKDILRYAGLELARHPRRPDHHDDDHSLLNRYLHDIEHKLTTLTHQGAHIMAAIDALKASVDSAVTEMVAAADFIRNHPAANNDPALQDMAARLQAAADALHGVDQPQ